MTRVPHGLRRAGAQECPYGPTRCALALMALMAVSGCSAPATGAAPAPSRAFGADSEVTRLSNEAYADIAIIQEPVTAVWPRLQVAYDLLDIPTEHRDAARYQLGNPSFRPRRIADQRMSRFLDCGQGNTARQNADTYAITMSVITTLIRGDSDGETRVETLVQATGKARDTSSRRVNCASTGQLEMLIVEMIGRG